MPPALDSSQRILETQRRWLNPDPKNRLLPERYGDLVTEKAPAATWSGFQEWVAKVGERWSFRGHADEYWLLDTTFGRKTTQFVQSDDGTLTSLERFVDHEAAILHEFQRAAHQYVRFTPADHEIVDWLALMQHHGAPTRLLDWTRSPYVALYFALETARPEKECAVWAVDLQWLEERSTEILRKRDRDCPSPSDFDSRYRYINRLLLRQLRESHRPDQDDDAVVVPVHPRRASQRMTAQQGHFLCNLNNHETFVVSLFRMIPKSARDPASPDGPLRKLIVSPCHRTALLKELRRMNIQSASLFPGLDGFARSLKIELEIRVEDDKANWRKTQPSDLGCGSPTTGG
jgi:hypothetical protein